MRGADATRRAGRTLAICGFAVGLIGAAPRRALEDKVPELKAARIGARERLGRPECQAVLTDFESVNGGRLDLVLRSTGRTAQEQLDLLSFDSGLGRPGCGRPVAASTHIQSRVVYICLRPFALLRPVERETVLIHEMLHSLGLGENPPTSGAITAQVMARCGH
ncbi:MAG: hypothetical protein ACHQNV_05885 [Vicinamibacteria bacterium]